MTPEEAATLRKAFPASAIGHLPKGGVMLDYVGHAATTDRLLQVDPEWSWEPFALTEDGLPALDPEGNLWIRLTVCGITRPGVGDGKNAKERIGDAIRNAAMRFGVALDLWAKEDLQAQNGNGPAAAPEPSEAAPLSPSAEGPGPRDAASEPTESRHAPKPIKPTKGQNQALGILVSHLRDMNEVEGYEQLSEPAISTENLWVAVANARGVDVTMMIQLLGGRDEDGVLHFGPLLSSLTRVEASNLRERLERLAQHVGATA